MQKNILQSFIVLLLSSFFIMALSGCSFEKEEEVPVEQEDVVLQPTFHLPADLHSSKVLVVDFDTGENLYEAGIDEQLYPASLTKVMTCVAGIMNYVDLDVQIDVTYENVAGLAEENASIAGLLVGQTMTYRDALYGLMLPSGADAGNVLADHDEGGREAFIADMNHLAKYIGMRDTRFLNTSGLHDPAHYTTLRDLKRLMLFAWNFPTFQDVFKASDYLSSYGTTFESTRNAYGDLTIDKGMIIGSKSGYTPEAGSCMISIAEIEGHLYMVISAGAPGDPVEEHYHLDDARAIYNQIATDIYTPQPNEEPQ